jgi:hypothetical protein
MAGMPVVAAAAVVAGMALTAGAAVVAGGHGGHGAALVVVRFDESEREASSQHE